MRQRRPRAPRLNCKLTQQLINEAVPRDSGHCMFAEAIKAVFPSATFVSVDLQTMRFTDPAKRLRYTYLTPRLAQVALIDFDQSQLPEPFAFQLRAGQVTQSGIKPRTEKQKQNRKKADLTRANLARQTLVRGRSPRDVHEKIGGRTPPTTPFARRRAFGLRALDRIR